MKIGEVKQKNVSERTDQLTPAKNTTYLRPRSIFSAIQLVDETIYKNFVNW